VLEGYEMTAQGLRPVGSGTLSSSGSKTPGIIAPAAVALATANPIGLIVVGATKIVGEVSGSNTPEGRAKATADAIAEQLRIRFRARGWIK
jgi:ribosomal protein S5